LNPIISVALCTYNGEKFLEKQLQSILHQSKMIDELLVFDDKSTDSTIQLLTDFTFMANYSTRQEVSRCR
jgi:glycosyltransferase involved in cell wall biosynthesis